MGRPKRQKGRKRSPKRTPNRPQNDQKTTPKSTKFRDDLFGAKRRIDLRKRRIDGSSLGRPSPPGTCPGTPFRAFKDQRNITILQYYNTAEKVQRTKGPRDPRTKGTKGSKGPKGPKDQRTQRKKLEKVMSIICHALGLWPGEFG